MQVCTSLQTDNHASTPPLSFFYRPDALTAAQPTASKHWRHFKKLNLTKQNKNNYNNSLSLPFVLCIFTTWNSAWNLASNFFARLDQLTLGRSTPKWYRQHLTTSIWLVLNNFINRRFTTKSTDDRSDLSSGQASKPNRWTFGKVTNKNVVVSCTLHCHPKTPSHHIWLTSIMHLWSRFS